MIVVTDNYSTKLMQPREKTFNFPAPLITAKFATILLSQFLSVAFMQRNHFNASLFIRCERFFSFKNHFFTGRNAQNTFRYIFARESKIRSYSLNTEKLLLPSPTLKICFCSTPERAKNSGSRFHLTSYQPGELEIQLEERGKKERVETEKPKPQK